MDIFKTKKIGGSSQLKKTFLSIYNYQRGRYLAELTKEMIERHPETGYEFLIPLFRVGNKSVVKVNDLSALAAWVIDNEIISKNTRFILSIDRLYDVLRSYESEIFNFSDFVKGIFVFTLI
jgi:AMP deaminase